VPWEVIVNEVDYDAERADVYSLAKTIWVLSTRQRFPLPGPQLANDPASSIASYTPHPLAGGLDEVVAQCTQNDPQLRPSLRVLANDLRGLLVRRDGLGELDEDPETYQRFAELMRPVIDEAGHRAALQTAFDAVMAAATEAFQPIQRRITELQPESKLWMPEILLVGWSTRVDGTGAPEVVSSDAIGFVAPGRDEIHDWTLVGGFAGELLGNGTVRMYAAYAAHVNGLQFTRIFAEAASATISSVQAPCVARELANKLVTEFGGAVTRWTKLMEGAD
jgi:hypothetical protein